MSSKGPLGFLDKLSEDTIGLDLNRIPLIGSLFSSGEEDQQIKNLRAAAERFKNLRPELEQSSMNALGQQMEAFRPTNAMLGSMMGDPSMMIDLESMAKSPMTPGMVAGGVPQTGQDLSNAGGLRPSNAMAGR